MALIFHARGDSLDARYSRAGKTPGFHQSDSAVADPVVTADAGTGIFGGSVIALAHATQQRAIYWPGRRNWTENPAFSVLLRIVPRFTGFPTVAQGIVYIGEPHGNYREGLFVLWNATTGTFGINMRNKYGSTLFAANTVATKSAVSGTPFDLMITWDGTTTANAIKVSVDGVEFETRTATAGLAAPRDLNRIAAVMPGFGIGASSGVSNWDLNEFAIWDSVEAHVYAARTDFIASSVFDGLSYSVPVAGDIKHGVAAIDAGVAITGTYRGDDLWDEVPIDKVDTGYEYLADGVTLTGASNDPAEGDVKLGVSYDNGSKTGTYTGADRWSDPGEANVRLGTAYEANDVAKVGTLAVPTAAQTKIGIAVDGDTGTYTGADRWSDPGEANVAADVEYLANAVTQTGTLDVVENELTEMTLTDQWGGSARRITQGDAMTFRLRCKIGAGYHDLTGSTFETKLVGTEALVTINNAAHTAADQTGDDIGRFEFDLSAVNTAALKTGTHAFVTKVTQGDDILHFHGQLTVLSSVPV